MRLFIFAFISLTFLSISTSFAQSIEDEVIAEVERSADAWNEGDIRGFMDSYHNSEALRFASGNSVERGWQATLERYLRVYGQGRQSMGQLHFSDLEVTVFSPKAALVFGRFHLQRLEKESTGLFTLTMQKFDERWQIIHDHTSSDD